MLSVVPAPLLPGSSLVGLTYRNCSMHKVSTTKHPGAHNNTHTQHCSVLPSFLQHASACMHTSHLPDLHTCMHAQQATHAHTFIHCPIQHDSVGRCTSSNTHTTRHVRGTCTYVSTYVFTSVAICETTTAPARPRELPGCRSVWTLIGAFLFRLLLFLSSLSGWLSALTQCMMKDVVNFTSAHAFCEWLYACLLYTSPSPRDRG